MKCPECRALHKPLPACPCCGHEYPRKVSVAHVPGTLKELIAGGYRKELTDRLWPEICGFAHTSKPTDPEAARKLALALFKDMTGGWPAASYENTERRAPSMEVVNKIKALRIRFARGRARAAA